MSEVRVKQLRRLYKKLPALRCKGLCKDACGPIRCSSLERQRLEEAAGRALSVDANLSCSMLQGNRCSAYEVRPLLCRLFGMVRQMRCPFGCEPERWLTDAEAHELLTSALRIGGAETVSEPPTER